MPAASKKRVCLNLQIGRIVACAALLALAGCAAQQEAGRYQQAPESTLTDAQAQARGRGTSLAPAQIQLGFGEDAAQREAQPPATEPQQANKAAIAAQARPLREAKTFLGTLPCLLGGACEASRVTLTLAPNGQWRARSQPLAAGAAATTTQQGCWEVTGTAPWRIRLSPGASESSTASFSFVNDNILRVNSVNDHQPLLDYHLTRQADIDGIEELNAAAAPACD
ncbi:hypothetical protein [Pusillimonas sp.]|uniref:hypothetical protein n=1 Tax=Pusillimonas sp. TaxID=3040095 RepID=UPI0037CA90D9